MLFVFLVSYVLLLLRRYLSERDSDHKNHKRSAGEKYASASAKTPLKSQTLQRRRSSPSEELLSPRDSKLPSDTSISLNSSLAFRNETKEDEERKNEQKAMIVKILTDELKGQSRESFCPDSIPFIVRTFTRCS